MADLSWTAETRYDCSGSNNWITINGSTGGTITGDSPSELVITISAASSANDCTSGYILFTTSNGDTKKIPITRCLPECNCSSINYRDNSISGTNFEASFETSSSSITLGYYDVNQCSEGIGVVSGCTIFKENSVRINGGVITAEIESNSGNARSDFYKITYNGSPCFEGRITQKGKVNDCYSARTCDSSITVRDLDDPIPCAGKSYEYEITASNCWSLEDVYYSCGDWFTVEPDDVWTGHIVVYKNDYGKERDGSVTFVLQNASNGYECNDLSVKLYQEACCTCGNITLYSGDTECETCNCNSDKLYLYGIASGGTITVSRSGINDYEEVARYEECISDDSINLVISNDWISGKIENGTISIKVAETQEDRMGQVTINYITCNGPDKYTKAIQIFQQRLTPCECSDITSFPTESDTYNVTIGGSVGDSTSITYSENCSMYIKNNASDFVNVSKNSNSIEITANSSLSSGSRSGTIEILTIQDGTVCKTINVTQQGGGGGCVAGTYHYILHVPQIPQPGVITGPYDIYLCRTHQISNPLEAQSLSTGGTKLEKVSTYYTVCDFDVDNNGDFVSVSDISNKINFVPTGGGDVTKTDFEVNKGYYICAVQTDDPTKFYPFGTQADLRTGTDVTCRDYTQEVNN